MTLDYHARIARDPRIAGGEATIKGTRVTLRTVLASLAEGATTEEILQDFPTLSREDIRAAIAFAAASAQPRRTPADSSLPRTSTSQTLGRSHPAPTMASCWFGYRNLAERRSRSEWSRSFEAKTSTPGLAVWSLQPCGSSG